MMWLEHVKFRSQSSGFDWSSLLEHSPHFQKKVQINLEQLGNLQHLPEETSH